MDKSIPRKTNKMPHSFNKIWIHENCNWILARGILKTDTTPIMYTIDVKYQDHFKLHVLLENSITFEAKLIETNIDLLCQQEWASRSSHQRCPLFLTRKRPLHHRSNYYWKWNRSCHRNDKFIHDQKCTGSIFVFESRLYCCGLDYPGNLTY